MLVAPGPHLPKTDRIEYQGAIARSRQRAPDFPVPAELDEALSWPSAGSCLHLKSVCCKADDFRLLDALERDIEAAGYEQAGDALGLHRSRKHLQIWGDALSGSKPYAALISHVLGLFDLTMVDSWVNLYRTGDDQKAWHHDNYQDRSPRPTVTLGISLGTARKLAFVNAVTKEEHSVLQENGDIFAFDEPFNNLFKHAVPPAAPGEVKGKRIAVIIWATEQEHVPRVVRARNPGLRDIVPTVADWEAFDTCGFGSLSRAVRAQQALKFQAPAGSSSLEEYLESLGQASHLEESGQLPQAAALVQSPLAPNHLPSTTGNLEADDWMSTLGSKQQWSQQVVGQTFYPPKPKRRVTPPQQRPGVESIPEAPTIRAASQEQAALEVSKALTLQGAQQVLAVLRGKKLIENRAWEIPVGWYAIHSGRQDISDERAARIREVWPNAPPEDSLPHGAILGLFYVHSHRKPEECRPGYVWARGPICHLVSKAIELPRPLPCSGNKGLWDLQASIKSQIRAQLDQATISHFDLTVATG